MANITLHASDLLEASHKMESASNKIDETLHKIDNIMSDLDSVWSDENSKKYLAKYEELKKEFPLVRDAIYNYSVFLKSVVSAYQKEFSDPTLNSINKTSS